MKWILLFLLSLVTLFFLINEQVPFFSDDINWIGSLETNNFSGFVESIINRQVNVWLTENGRAMNHLLWQITVANGDLCYDVFISVVFVFYLWSAINLAAIRFVWSSLFLWSIAAFSTLYLSPASSSNFYWAAGGCHYLWPAMLSIVYLILLKKSCINKFSIIKLTFLSFFSFVAGWTHEIFALPISFALFCMIIYNICKGKHLSKQHFCLIIPFWLGALLIVVSPGTIARIAGNGGAEGATFLSALLAKAVTSFKIFRYGRCFYVLLALLVYLALSKKKSLVEFVKDNVFLCLCCLGSLGIVVILGVGGRAVWGVEVFSLLIIIKWVNSVLAHSDKSAVWNKIGAVLAVIIIVHQACLIKPFKESWDTYRAVVEQTKQSNFEETASMEQWKSDNPLIDPFVAHPYEMMMEDMWMRIPLHCNVCRTDVYDYLKKINSSYMILITSIKILYIGWQKEIDIK